MGFHLLRMMAVIMVAEIVTACSTQSTTDPKVAELEKRLAEAEKQLADAAQQGQRSEPVPAPLAATEEKVAPVATPRPAAPAVKAGSSAKPVGAKPTRPTSPPESQKYMTAAQAEREKAEIQRLVEEQQAVNAKQAEANRELREEVERLKPQEFYTLAEGTIIPVRTSTELSTAKLSNGSTFDGLLVYDLKAGQTVLAKAGTRVTCVVVSSDPGGRVKGIASLIVSARSVVGVKGNVIALKTDNYSADAESTKRKTRFEPASRLVSGRLSAASRAAGRARQQARGRAPQRVSASISRHAGRLQLSPRRR